MRKKIRFLLILFFLLLAFLTLTVFAQQNISGNNKRYKQDVTFIMPKMYFIDEGYIYYISQKDNCIYSIKTDGSIRKKLADDRVFTDGLLLSGMIVDNKYIYYIDELNNNRLCRINKDGTEKIYLTKRSIEPSDGFFLMDKYIYYFSDFRFYKISLNGIESVLSSSENEICNMYFNSFKKIHENRNLYFLQRDGIYSITIDGKNKRKAASGGIYDFQIQNGSVFYINENDLCLYKNGKKIVSSRILMDTGDAWIGSFEIKNGYIYYTNADEDMTLYKIKTDGTCNEKISDIKAYSFKIDDSCIYYIDNFDNGGLFKYDLNKKNKKEIAKGEFLNVYEVTGDFIFYSAKWEFEGDFYLGRCFAAEKNNETIIEIN